MSTTAPGRATPSRVGGTGPAVVAAVPGASSVDAAVDEATRRDARLVLLVPLDTPIPRLARILRRCHARSPGLRITPVRGSDCPPVWARPADVFVLDAADVTAAIVDDGRSTLLLVPPGGEPDGPVVLGLAPWTGGAVAAAAVREARARGVGLRVLQVWSDPAVDPGLVGDATLRRWDVHDAGLRDAALRTLAPWRVAGDPDPEVLVVRDEADESLALFAAGACVLVVGHRGGGRSPAAPLVRLARTVSCPLLIVPDT
ncbi:universal stress protein [Pseudonocardia sp. McavD-2-B]|uniref:universal stress protein n=1 Tax=Pseudonocardia sp. McavD-2-B TaxID=2954499 RepID=UPI0020985F7C|nr:universal stress protein [Pseudonocardia sp. McavD-2-B]MCO7196699.1 universal stress protein [Pseudonocardia sp. McavD-2-B]